LREEAERLRKEAQRREQEAQRREQEAHQREQEAERLREDAQRREQEAERLREEERQRYERRTGKTTLPEFLDACHTHLCLGLTIQPDTTQSTQGDAANADNKPRPERILPWPEFDAEQARTWEDLMGSEFVLERHFTSLHTLEESGDTVRGRQMGSELDLNSFARFTVEDPVSQIIKRLSEDSVLRDRFGLKGSVKFENHSNTLSPDRTTEQMQSLSISDNPRRSERLRAHANKPGRTDASKSSKSTTKSSRPRADQFCVYNVGGEGETEHRVTALTIEYKAPHKLTLGHIYEGLAEMNLDEVVEVSENEGVAIRCRRLVAAVITQGFSYMVKAGVEYGEIYTGEATIFLRIPDDPSTVYYSLSVPKGDVGKVKLPGFGYTVAAKGTGIECVSDLMHESTVYRRLLPVQGKCVPVHLGETKVDSILYYAGAVRIVYMMFLSFGGFQLRSPISQTLADDAICGLHAIHRLGVLQGDSEARNILVHPDRLGITWIDFERAEFIRPRAVLGSLSPNRKQKGSWSHEEGRVSMERTAREHLHQRYAKLRRSWRDWW
ncbi:hypothetical protein V502_01605, partial [Pseudogymnoascus sp. VKM F-4520 (FW-2644)]